MEPSGWSKPKILKRSLAVIDKRLGRFKKTKLKIR